MFVIWDAGVMEWMGGSIDYEDWILRNMMIKMLPTVVTIIFFYSIKGL